MSLLNLFGAPRLKPRWSFSTTHILWRFLVSDDGLILGEDRDTDGKTVSFFCIDMNTGAVLWRDKNFGEAWWIGIEALVGERMYLHGFAQPDMPEHHGLIALDARTGVERWQNADISFYAADADHVIGYRDLFERRVFERFDASTGVFLGELAAADDATEAMRQHTFGRTDFIFAQPLAGDDSENAAIQKILVKHNPVPEVQAAVEFARIGSRLLFSAHLAHASSAGVQIPKLQNILCVVNTDSGREEYFEVLNAETPYPVPDSFFVDHEMLYYIKEKRTLCAVPLA
jgi:hypothetical protein